MNSEKNKFVEPEKCGCCQEDVWSLEEYTRICENCNVRVCSYCDSRHYQSDFLGDEIRYCMTCSFADFMMSPGHEFEDPPRALVCCSKRAERNDK